MKIRGNAFFPTLVAAIVAAGALLSTGAVAQDVAREPFRVCADPDNLPFSRAEGAEHGLYVELAELVAKKLGMPIEYTWWYTQMQRRALRNTILQGECDAVFALPANADYRVRGVQKSKPFLDVGYALVAKPGFMVSGLEGLKGQRIALQYSSTPHIYFSTLSGYTTTTYRSPAEVFDALQKGEVDVGILWGPIAGYENNRLHQGRWQITPLTGHDMGGQVVIGVRAAKAELKDRIDAALRELQPEIRALAEKYAFPLSPPLNIEPKPASALATPSTLALQVPARFMVTVADEAKPAAKAASRPQSKPSKAAAKAHEAPAAAAESPQAPADPQVSAGKVRFNDQCSHCHGANGASPVMERDVRRLKSRYDAKWQEVALTTIRNGRPAAGMPTWGGVIGEPEIQQLMSFLGTIQK